jgi:hypothetical protein
MHEIIPLPPFVQVQVMLPVESKLQSRPHAPQFVLLTKSTQEPPQQPGCAPALHAVPHVPQFIASVARFTHVVPQQVWPPAQAG